MKRLLIGAFIALGSLQLHAQIKTPAASPSASLTQTIGLTDIAIEYSRPSMKGREIFGKLLPYGEVWRTGANATTKFTTDKALQIGGKELPAGTYSLYTIPGKSEWDVVFYTDDSNPLLNELDDSKIALRTLAETEEIPMAIETFTISIDDITPVEAVLGLMWENTYVAVPFKVDTDKEVMSQIEQVMNGPGAGDYYSAAVYYLNADKDINKAKEWMNKAIEMTDTPRYWQLRQQALILAKAGDEKAAIKAAEASLDGAKEAGNADYIRMNEASLKEWGAM